MPITSKIPQILVELVRVYAPPPPDKLDALSMYEAAQVIEKWFFINFDNPIHHNSAVGVDELYRHVERCPIKTRDIIEAVFANILPGELIEYATAFIEAEGDLWVYTVKDYSIAIMGTKEMLAELSRRDREYQEEIDRVAAHLAAYLAENAEELARSLTGDMMRKTAHVDARRPACAEIKKHCDQAFPRPLVH